jgi:hypothetical protein
MPAHDTWRAGDQVVPDFLTLKVAIYFILPAVVLYVVAYVGAELLNFTAQMVVEDDVSHDTAVRMMAMVIGTAAGVAALVYWITQVRWATLAAGTVASFFVGAFVFSQVFKDSSSSDQGGSVKPIGWARGSLISAILTLVGLALTWLLLRATGRAP